MALIRIGSIDLPDPKEYNVSLQDIDSENTKRTETGILIRQRVRAGVCKVEALWIVTKSDLKIITDALSPAKFSVTFFDPTTATNPTKQMYAGDRQGRLVVIRDDGVSWWELSASLVEY